MKEDRITIKDIAREAGVSKSTVSRAINNGHGIDIKTKDRILDIIENIISALLKVRENYVVRRVEQLEY